MKHGKVNAPTIFPLCVEAENEPQPEIVEEMCIEWLLHDLLNSYKTAFLNGELSCNSYGYGEQSVMQAYSGSLRSFRSNHWQKVKMFQIARTVM